ncbi:DUF998 domain-containing protein [Streptacidiphilus monticola]|uniref:DUF998 domain-containing protein n=1 Tax=Streptacidiphilus monticola TaxID=2161674 RepID=A0ABW1G8M5_9ACTN
MRLVSWWALISSACAPVVLVGGWTVAERLYGPGYDWWTDTISTLASDGAAGRWVMTAAVIGLGICHLITAIGLRAASLAGRLALAAGGVTAFVLAWSPEPPSGGSLRHGWVVAIGFTLLALWPVLAARGRPRESVPWTLRVPSAVAVTVLLALGAVWFVLALRHHGAAGLAERVLTTAQSLWPFVVVASCLRSTSRT